MQEIIRFGSKYNANKNTFYGLSGLGDLTVTAFSKHSRNRELGILLSNSKTLQEAKQLIDMVVEGVNTTKILNILINKHNLNMPITRGQLRVTK